MSLIYFLMGKSASGKNHIADALLADEDLGLKPVILYTTRPMRIGEEDGVDYHFVDDSQEKSFMDSGKIIEERIYHTVKGDWKYFTADDGIFDNLEEENFLAIGTPDAYEKYRDYFGEDKLWPIYVEVNNGNLLARAVKREGKQENPNFEEVYRRFQADRADFAEERMMKINNLHRFSNDGSLEDCIDSIKSAMKKII